MDINNDVNQDEDKDKDIKINMVVLMSIYLAELVGSGKEFCLVARRGESPTTLAFSSCIAFGIICLIIMMRVVADYDDPDEEVGESLT